MSRRASSLNRVDSGMARELDTRYAHVKKVADNIEAVVKAASVDLETLADALNEATDFEGITVVAGTSAAWDPVTKVLTVPTVKGDTGASLTMTSVVANPDDTFTWAFSDGTEFTTPALRGAAGSKGNKGDKGDTGAALTMTSVTSNLGDTFTWHFSDGSSFTTPSLRGTKGDRGLKGDRGQDVTVSDITYLGTGVFRWTFSDGFQYITPDLRGPTGPRGEKGSKGLKGDQGVSVHHLRPTSTTDPLGRFGVFGEYDTYTFYGDPNETNMLGHFTLRNGLTPDQMAVEGFMRRSAYDPQATGTVNDSRLLEGNSLQDVHTFTTDRTGNTASLNTVAKDLTGAVNEVGSALGSLNGHVVAEVDRLDHRINAEQVTRGQAALALDERITAETAALEAAAVQESLTVNTRITNEIAGLNGRVDTEVDTLNARITSEVVDIDADLATLAADKYDKTGGHIGGDVSISGKLTVQGGMAEVEAEHVRTSDTIIRVNDGEAGAGVTAGFAGMEVDRGTEEDYEFGFNESTKLFEVGKAGGRQPLLTRMLAPVADKFFRWNASTKQAETVDITWGDVTGKLSNVSKTEAEVGTSTTARFWSSLRVREAILGWWNSSTSKTKLDGIETGAQVNVATNLAQGTRTATAVPVTSSTGTDATLQAASATLAGVMTAADKTKLDGIETGAQVNTVTSVASKTGAVTLAKGDVGLGNVDNVRQAPIARTLTAGDGLTGGGNLEANRTFAVDSTVLRSADRTSSRTDTTTGKLLKVGDFGIGGNGASTVSPADFNGSLPSGVYNTPHNTGITTSGGCVIVASSGSRSFGFAASSGNTKAFELVGVSYDSSRGFIKEEIYHTGNLLSTDSRTNNSTSTLLQAKAMNDHRTSGDHDGRYVNLSGGQTRASGLLELRDDLFAGQLRIHRTGGSNYSVIGYFSNGSEVGKLGFTGGGALVARTGTSTNDQLTLSTSGVLSTSGGFSGDGSSLTDLDAGNISTGTLPTARGGTGRTDGRSPRWITGRTLTIGNTGKTVDGSANVSWSLAEIGANFSAGNGISLSGTTFSVAAGTGLTQDASGLSLNAIAAGSGTIGALRYNGNSRSNGHMYGGTAAPTNTTRLNFDGNFHATKHVANTHNVGTGTTGFDIAYNSTTKSLDFNFVG